MFSQVSVCPQGGGGHAWQGPWVVGGIKYVLMYRSGTVNSKSFVGKVLLRIKWKFELTYAL